MAGREHDRWTKRKGALRPPRFRGSLAGECGSVFRDHLGFQHRIAQLRECSGAILGGVVAFQIHTHGAILEHHEREACEAAIFTGVILTLARHRVSSATLGLVDVDRPVLTFGSGLDVLGHCNAPWKCGIIITELPLVSSGDVASECVAFPGYMGQYGRV